MKKILATTIALGTALTMAVPTLALNQGDQGKEVQKMQEALIEQGFLDGTADGEYGQMTEAAVKAFRESIDMEAEGGADEEVLVQFFGFETQMDVLNAYVHGDTSKGVYDKWIEENGDKFQSLIPVDEIIAYESFIEEDGDWLIDFKEGSFPEEILAEVLTYDTATDNFF